jgi:polar amino acid transport system permease protein
MNALQVIDFSILIKFLPVIGRGLLVTLELWCICAAVAFGLGLLLALGRLSRFGPLRLVLNLLFEVFRDTPVLVQLIWLFYVFPILAGVHLSAFAAAVLGLSLNSAAYSSEIFRAGIVGLSRGQWEAGAALGMGRAVVLRRIILPQAIGRMIPAFANRAIELAKMTSLASVLSVHELMYQARLLNTTFYRPLETFTVVAIIYLVVISPAAMIAAHLEQKVAVYA